MSQFIDLIDLDKIPENSNLSVELDGVTILICRLGKTEGYAVENQCSHALSPLEGGTMKSHYIFCPLHGVKFNLKNGCPSGKLTKKNIKTFPVKVENESISIMFEK